MPEAVNDRLSAAQEIIQRHFTEDVLAALGQELYNAYDGARVIMRDHMDRSTFRETAPPLLRGLVETAMKNLGSTLPGALCTTEPNARNTSSHNELQLGNQLVLSAARCHKRTGRSRPAEYRRAHSVRNAPFMFPEILDIPDVRAGAKLTGYIEHLPKPTKEGDPAILRVVFPTPDYLSEIATIDLMPYVDAARGQTGMESQPSRSVPEIEEAHDLTLVEVQKTE